MDEDKKPLDEMQIIDDPQVHMTEFGSQATVGRGDRCMVCCLLFGLLTLLVYIASIVVFGALYYLVFIRVQLTDLEGKVSQLEMQLNQSQFLASSLTAQLSGSQITTTVNSAITSVNNAMDQLSSERISLNSTLQGMLAQTQMNYTQEISGTDVNNLDNLVTQAQVAYNDGVQQLETLLQTNRDRSVQFFMDDLISRQAVYQITITNEEGGNFSRGIVSQLGGGTRSTYVRWGSSSCPNVAGTTLLYSGYMAGAAFFQTGAGHNHLCLPMDPDIDALPTEPGQQTASTIFGAEYAGGPKNDQNLPCAVCSVTIGAEVIMIPQRNSCPSGWTMEYDGYLMSEGPNNFRTSFSCIDRSLGALPDSGAHSEATDVFTVRINCDTGSLFCPPYDGSMNVGCAVCSK